MTRRPGWRGEMRWSRADAEKPDDTKTPEVAVGPERCHGAWAPLPNRGRQRRAKRSPLHAGLGRAPEKALEREPWKVVFEKCGYEMAGKELASRKDRR